MHTHIICGSLQQAFTIYMSLKGFFLWLVSSLNLPPPPQHYRKYSLLVCTLHITLTSFISQIGRFSHMLVYLDWKKMKPLFLCVVPLLPFPISPFHARRIRWYICRLGVTRSSFVLVPTALTIAVFWIHLLKKHFQLISYQTFPFPIIRYLPFYLLSEQSARVTVNRCNGARGKPHRLIVALRQATLVPCQKITNSRHSTTHKLPYWPTYLLSPWEAAFVSLLLRKLKVCKRVRGYKFRRLVCGPGFCSPAA